MSRSRSPCLAPVWALAAVAGAVISCGSRTALFSDEDVGRVTSGPEPAREAGVDARPDVALDALPPVDVAPRADVDRTGCADASDTYVYVVSEENELMSFHPPTLAFRTIGRLACPVAGDATPFSMAVDRRGVAYVVFNDGTLYRVSTATAACIPTAYVPEQEGWRTFGMGFASDVGGPEEHLFVAENNFERASAGLGRIDPATMRLAVVGPFLPSIPRAELTGTADGRLFAFWPNPGDDATGSHLAEIDKRTADVIAATDLPVARGIDAFAFAFWGGDFWIFTGRSGTSTVSRFRPGDGTTVDVTTRAGTIVGAGVSTCAPSE